MSEKSSSTKKECLEKFELSNKPTLIITEGLKKKIAYLHEKCGATEWSGELITREEGTINDLDDWKIIAEDVFLADIGSPSYTAYEVGKGSFKTEDIMDMHEQFPGILAGTHKCQHVHSHGSMSAFFSGTDWEQMNDRALVSNYLLMLIVNFDGKWCAKVGFKAKMEGKKETKLSFFNNSDGFKPLKIGGDDDKERLVVMDCKIVVEETQVDGWFNERWEAVKKQKLTDEEERKKKIYTPAYYRKGFGGQQGKLFETAPIHDRNGWFDEEWSDSVDMKPKKTGEMTEKEWKESQSESTGIGKFELRHAKCFLNSILDGTYSPYDFTDCLKKIEEHGATIHGYEDFSVWIEQFEDGLQEHFDVLFPYKNQDDYISLLKEMVDYLLPYRQRNELISAMVDSVNDEIELYKEPKIFT